MTYDELISITKDQHLTIFNRLAESTDCIILFRPHKPSYWPTICGSPEWGDRMPDPVPRWPHLIIERLAQVSGSKPRSPFAEQPAPFLKWALASDRAQQSLVGRAIQAEVGLLACYRGALALLNNSIRVLPRKNPCPSGTKPYMTACPAGIITYGNYDSNTYLDYMRADPEQSCLSAGCTSHRAYSIGSLHQRMAEHSAYYMQQFLK